MKQLLTVLTCALLFYITTAKAQDSCACCSADHKAFDFWIGDWDVFDTTGKKIGQNSIEKIEDGCLLNEQWKSPFSTGRSYNYFNRNDSTWNQVWMDNAGNPLVLKGGFENGSMVMYTEPYTDKGGLEIKSRLRWTLESDGSVSQIWEALNLDGKVEYLIFHGIYRKKK